ncbi:Zinc finger SWIM-type [Perkinsela sp. CCAP 1560/4]|nr:Zinc finger SWIM-type [Perkinsela sp. CCAP 1560/4]|eukprot:KNH07246.1 Zinc finger SWIM-type [Perkinsela sp. CCAP 1560/4]
MLIFSTCSCPYSVQCELPCCHLIAVAQRQGLTCDNDAWMRAICAKFLQRDYYVTLQGCIVRQVLLQHLSPDGVTTGPVIVVPRRQDDRRRKAERRRNPLALPEPQISRKEGHRKLLRTHLREPQ